MTIELAPGEQRELNVVLVPTMPPGVLTIERFFVVNRPSGSDGEFDAHCYIRNTGGSEAAGQIHCIGQIFVGGGRLVMEIDETEDIVVQPGAVYDYVYGYYSVRGDSAWVQVIGDWGEQTPRLDFTVGYHNWDPDTLVELACTAVGSDYAILRYSQRSMCSIWDFSCTTPPPPAEPEQRVEYPTLQLDEKWGSISHAMLGLLPGRQYRGKASGYRPGAAHREASVLFNTV